MQTKAKAAAMTQALRASGCDAVRQLALSGLTQTPQAQIPQVLFSHSLLACTAGETEGLPETRVHSIVSRAILQDIGAVVPSMPV